MKLVNNSKELLKTELLIFKTKIERFGYIVQFKNEDIIIIDPQNSDKNQNNNISKQHDQNIDLELNDSLFRYASKKASKFFIKYSKKKRL